MPEIRNKKDLSKELVKEKQIKSTWLYEAEATEKEGEEGLTEKDNGKHTKTTVSQVS